MSHLCFSVFIINRLPTHLLHDKTPLEFLFNIKPYYNFLKVFRCSYFLYLRPYTSHKLEPHSFPRTFKCYTLRHKGYKCLLTVSKVYKGRYVLFDEKSFSIFLTVYCQTLSFSQVSLYYYSCSTLGLILFFYMLFLISRQSTLSTSSASHSSLPMHHSVSSFFFSSYASYYYSFYKSSTTQFNNISSLSFFCS